MVIDKLEKQNEELLKALDEVLDYAMACNAVTDYTPPHLPNFVEMCKLINKVREEQNKDMNTLA